MDKKYLGDLRKHIAITSIGTSTLRNQGAPKVIERARKFLTQMNLSPFGTSKVENFQAVLDRTTKQLQQFLPKKARNWAAARKAINISLRNSFYNVFLNEEYRLGKAERLYELPLDSIIANKLREYDPTLPNWSGLKYAESEELNAYQKTAWKIAKKKKLPRIHLDVLWWAEGR